MRNLIDLCRMIPAALLYGAEMAARAAWPRAGTYDQ